MNKIIAPSGGGAGGGGAPTTADYLVRTADSGLSAERVVTDTATVTWDWATAGQAKANAAGGGGSSDVVVALASDVVHATNSTALSNITGFTFSTSASATELWRVECLLLTTVNAAGANTADLKFGWTFPAGVTGFWTSQIEREVVTGSTQPTAPSIAAPISFGGSGTIAQGMIAFHVLIAGNGNAGPVQLQFAQNNTIAGAVVTIKRTSTMIARKVAT